MFSINDDETVQLKQHERRVVEYVEYILADSTAQVVAMQVQCTAPDCVPIETVVLVLFPKDSNKEGGKHSVPPPTESSEKLKDASSVQFKILKPIAEVTKEDVETSLPLSLRSGSLTAIGRQIRNDLCTRIEQLFATEEEEDMQSRQWVSRFLQESLQQYVDNGCRRPVHWEKEDSNNSSREDGDTSVTSKGTRTFPPGNIILRRPIDDEADKIIVGSSSIQRRNVGASVQSMVQQRQQTKAVRSLQSGSVSNSLTQLSQREHAPGIRRPGCPCCDPENAANIMDRLLSQM